MEAVDGRLVRRDHSLIQLLDPPFDKSSLDPAHQGYVPGVRGERRPVHARRDLAAMAFAALGDPIGPGADEHDQPGEYADTPEAWRPTRPSVRVAAMSTRWRRTPPRRMELVHRLGRMDVPAHRRVPAGGDARGAMPSLRAVLPSDWVAFTMLYRHGETTYESHPADAGRCRQESRATRVSVDGVAQPDGSVHLADDRTVHYVEVDVQGRKVARQAFVRQRPTQRRSPVVFLPWPRPGATAQARTPSRGTSS